MSRLWAFYNDADTNSYELCDSPNEKICQNSLICNCLAFKPDLNKTGDIYCVTSKELICVRIYAEG